jgi:hypothetical protein
MMLNGVNGAGSLDESGNALPLPKTEAPLNYQASEGEPLAQLSLQDKPLARGSSENITPIVGMSSGENRVKQLQDHCNQLLLNRMSDEQLNDLKEVVSVQAKKVNAEIEHRLALQKLMKGLIKISGEINAIAVGTDGVRWATNYKKVIENFPLDNYKEIIEDISGALNGEGGAGKFCFFKKDFENNSKQDLYDLEFVLSNFEDSDGISRIRESVLWLNNSVFTQFREKVLEHAPEVEKRRFEVLLNSISTVIEIKKDAWDKEYKNGTSNAGQPWDVWAKAKVLTD